ncbi:MAG: methyl-accepting chemotaxis protein [Oscillospiraceae bacterium]|nr:methyl-accepting chemotaxis protein [Oscillospiraceae bacterium]
MSKIGKKLIAVMTTFIVIAVAMIVSVNCIQFNSLIKTSLSNEAEVGSNILSDGIKSLCAESDEINAELSENVNFVQAFTLGRGTVIQSRFEEFAVDDCFFAYFTDASGDVLWQSDNATMTTLDVDAVLAGNSYSGYVGGDENMPLYYISAVPVYNAIESIVGTSFIGVDFSDEEYIDNVASSIAAEITVFAGDTCIATTVLNEDGSRAVGTQMSDEVREIVIENGQKYEGRADILGQSHFRKYVPIADNDGNIVGAYFSGMSTAENDAMLRSSVMTSIILAVVLCIVIVVSLTLFTNKEIIKPVISANEISREMADGNLSMRMSNTKFPQNEIGEMVSVLNHTKDSLAMYMRDMTEVMGAMGEGDFTVTPRVEYVGEFTAIKNAMESIQRELGEVVGHLSVSASEVTAGSSQIANGSQLLADGTTRQAAAIQELSATINDISEKIKLNAENAKKADELASEASRKVETQSEEMVEMSKAMNDIKEKSAQIEDIIKTIEDIAFQTNILALNAAVEAARAGEAGKGFAVVADEVRNLATKSDEATKQTAAIIGETIEAVENGSAVLEITGKTMAEVSEITERTNALVREISDASEEQAESVLQVTEGIAQISEVVQQNSATAEESAASCEELNSQAALLMEQVEKFKVDEI